MNDDATGAHAPSVATATVKGAEVLLVDQDERVRDGFCKLLTGAGAMVTAVEEEERALELATEKFFAVAVVDVDTPTPGEGIALFEQLKQRSPNTEVVLLTARQTFDLAAAGFRAGAADVIAKEPSHVKYLTETVVDLCAKSVETDETKRLLTQTVQVLDQFLERLMAASRKAVAAEEQAGIVADPEDVCRVLIVDDNPRNAPGLQRALGESDYQVITALTGGEALDCAGSQRFHLALVKQQLPDLPSSMVVTSLKAEVPESIVLLFSPPTDEVPGRVDIIEGSKTIEMIPSLEKGEQLLSCVHELRQAYRAKLRERRYLRIFREEHYDFLRRYVELKQRLGNLLESE